MNDNPVLPEEKIHMHVFSFLLAGVTGVIGIFEWFKLRSIQKVIVAITVSNTWSWKAIEEFSFIGLGILWLITVFLCQYYYEKGIKKGRMLKNFLLVTGIELLLYFASNLVLLFFGRSELGIQTILFIVMQCAVGIAAIVIAVYHPAHR